MNSLSNAITRQSNTLRTDLDNYASAATSTPALQGQLSASLASLSKKVDDYSKAIDVELVETKKATGAEKLLRYKSDLAEFRQRFADLKNDREQQSDAQARNELLGRRPHATQTPENPYADAAISSGTTGGNVNPLFRTNNPNFQAGSGGPNSYSSYQSPYGLGTDNARENHALREQSFFSSSNATLDEYLERGRTVLGDLGDQRETLKGVQKKIYNVGNTLGISGDTIRMVERRAKQDKWIFGGGCVVFVVFVYLVLHYLR